MSIEALNWALNDAPGVPTRCVSVLIGLANHADPDGRNAWAGQARLARYARKSTRAVREDLSILAGSGLIRVADSQAAVAHLRPDKRPVVYDLALSMRGHAAPAQDQDDDAAAPTGGSTLPPDDGTGGTVLPPGSTVPGGTLLPPGESDIPAQGETAAGSTVPPGTVLPAGSTTSSGRNPASTKPTTKPRKRTTSSSGTPTRKRAAQTDDAAAPAVDAPVSPQAQERNALARDVVAWWWEQQNPRPAGGQRAYFASVTVVEQLLAVGWRAFDIASAARAAGSPLTVPRLEIELGRARRNSTLTTSGTAAPGASTADQRVAQARAAGAAVAAMLQEGRPT